jgi:hypothetical protein
MKTNIDEALQELNRLREDACSGKLTEIECKMRFSEFRKKYGDDLIYKCDVSDFKNEPASKEKLRKLCEIQLQGGTSEEVFLEIAKTGRKLRKKKTVGIIAVIAAIAAVAAIVALIVTISKK